jgi:hypothetical protein
MTALSDRPPFAPSSPLQSLNDVEPFTYLRDIPQRMTEDHPMSRLDELLPWNWPKMRVKH